MTQWKLPENLQDLLPAQAKKLETYRRQLLDLYENSGYQFIMPSLLEYEDSLNAHGKDLNLDTFKVVDQLSGKMMGVTSDLTTQASRMDAYLANTKTENKFCYAGPVIRTKASQDQSRELYQVGIEYYGNAKIDADKEVVLTLIKSLKLLNINNIIIDINHLDIYLALKQQLTLSAIDEVKLADAVMLKDKQAVQQILKKQNDQASINSVLQLLELYGDKNTLNDLEKLFKNLKVISQCLGVVKELIQLIEQAGATVSLDFADIRGYQYHTGLIFSAYSPQFKSVIAQGGRYDNLNEAIGQQRPATGFSLDLRYLINYL
jgi:ATP phosphoribosyltransferase regulatory subunit